MCLRRNVMIVCGVMHPATVTLLPSLQEERPGQSRKYD